MGMRNLLVLRHLLTRTQSFYINLPLAAVVTPVYVLIMPSWRGSSLPFKEKLHLDWIGFVLNVATFTLAITALTFSGSSYPWNSSTAIGLWTATGVSLVAFVTQQYFHIFTKEPIFPGHFLRNRDMVLLSVATSCAATCSSTTLYYIPIFFAFTKGDSALQAAVRLLPFIVMFIFFILVAGATLPKIGRYALYYSVGGALMLAGTAAMFTVRFDTPSTNIYGYEVLIAAGAGLVFQNAYTIATAKVPDRSNALGFINVSQVGFIAIALSVAGCLYQNLGFSYLQSALSAYNLPDAAIHGALGGVGSATLATAPQQVIDITTETVAFTISRVFALPLAAAALCFLASLLMKQEKLQLSLEAGG